ncbi:Transcription antitermination factor NusB [Nitrospina gracilis 3/211]|uniref:Transcription antitermination protein NusB n=1 Tax=Nitrospina gracilis (strain 3/211) TaxID=1266370 RepID=M1Z2L1_NITG3|nr:MULTISPECIES: transcription antitermination factor NusB [Nitrospina]MCF8724716.1 N utilization substance protein B [Nitrospina sp. Nb-3]CCQ91988.1 Transcription antitermination factor NusB [Nitrospina gracilis 3/211]
MGKRRYSRELVVKFLYLVDMNEGPVAEQLEQFWERNTCQPEIKQYAEDLLNTIFSNKKAIDTLLEKYSDNWTLSRMAVIDRNLLRLATCEILYGNSVPPKVAIDEAVEIAKKYGSEDSPNFINGILDRVLKEKSTVAEITSER